MSSTNRIEPDPLTASKKGSFAYTTVKDRLPVTITKAIDFIHRSNKEFIKRYSQDASEDVKSSIERLSGLRYELTTDKPFRKILDSASDADMWNKSIDTLEQNIGKENCTWFKGPWLYGECYLYRRIREAMLLCQTDFKYQDPFEEAKLETYKLNRNNTHALVTSLCPLDDDEKNDFELLSDRFRIILETLLWSNKNDLSLSSGNDVSSKVSNLIESIESFKNKILCDHTQNLWNFLNNLKKNKKPNGKPVRIDIILDNCSIELASDLILSDFLLRNEYVDKIFLHAKAYPWFISDVTKHDFDYQIKELQASNSLATNKFVTRLRNYIKDEKIVIESENPFWTSPFSFHEMETYDQELYSNMKESSSLVILKGDLNYRKLLGDLNWPFDTPLSDAIKGFKPTSICAIRTVKSDLIANLDTNTDSNPNYNALKQEHQESLKWMGSGDWGVIQFLEI